MCMIYVVCVLHISCISICVVIVVCLCVVLLFCVMSFCLTCLVLWLLWCVVVLYVLCVLYVCINCVTYRNVLYSAFVFGVMCLRLFCMCMLLLCWYTYMLFNNKLCVFVIHVLLCCWKHACVHTHIPIVVCAGLCMTRCDVLYTGRLCIAWLYMWVVRAANQYYELCTTYTSYYELYGHVYHTMISCRLV